MLIPANETIKDQLIHARFIPEGRYAKSNGDDGSTKLQSGSFSNSLPPPVAFAQQYRRLIQSHCFLTGPVDVLDGS